MTSRSLINRLTKEIEGEFLSDNFSRGRYSTDASIYQLMPVGVVVPKSINDVEATIKIAREEGLPVLPRVVAPRKMDRQLAKRCSLIQRDT